MVERHYCKFCNAWMQGDKASVRHHEQGRKHREKVEEALKRQRQAKTDAQRSERELRDQLRAIEEEALARHAQDLAASGAPPPPPPRRGQAPPPPPRRRPDEAGGRRPSGDSSQRRRADGDGEGQDFADDAEQQQQQEKEEEVDDFGVYEARGQVFLEGKRHEDKLETGSACEIWVEDAEEWLGALIDKAEVLEIPNTDRSFRRLTVTYLAPGAAQPVTESDVYADRLRIRMPAGMTLETAQRTIRQMETGEIESMEEAVVVDETTGMGEWTTVVVREIDESEAAVAQREAEVQAEVDALAALEKRREALEDLSAQGDNALGAYNPWGGNYKGVQLDEVPSSHQGAREDDVDAIQISTNGDVGFKKRKKAGGDKKQKRIRTSDDD